MPRFLVVVCLFSAAVADAGGKNVLPVKVIGQETNNWCWATTGEMIFGYLGASKLRQCVEANHEFGRDDCCGSNACKFDTDCIPANTPVSCGLGGKDDDGNVDCTPPNAPFCKTSAECTGGAFCYKGACTPNLCRAHKCTPSVCGGVCIPAGCNLGGSTEFAPWDFTSKSSTCNTLLTFAQFKAEIDAHRPVEFAWSDPCADAGSPECYPVCGGQMGSGGHVLAAGGYNDNSVGAGQMVLVNDPWPQGTGSQYWVSYADWVQQKVAGTAKCADPLACNTHYTQVHIFDIADDGFCRADNDGFAAASFPQCMNYQALRGRNPVTISYMENAGAMTVASSFQNVPPRTVGYLMSYQEFGEAFAAQLGAGYRPESLSVVVDAGTPLVTAIFKLAEAPFYSRCAMTPTDLVNDDTDYVAQGFIMTDFFGYSVGGAENFCATWVQKAGSYLFYFDLDDSDYATTYAQNSPSWEPVRTSAYDTPVGRRYAVLWLPSSGTWATGANMTPEFYQSSYNSLSGQGYVESSITSLGGNYSVLWTKTTPLDINLSGLFNQPPPPPPPPVIAHSPFIPAFPALQFQVVNNPDDYGTGDVPVAHIYTLQNIGSSATSAITTSLVDGDPTLWSTSIDTCNGMVLGAGDLCSIEVVFRAGTIASGSYAASLLANAATGGLVSIAMTGTASYTWQDCPTCGYQGDTSCTGTSLPSGNCPTPGAKYAYVVANGLLTGTQNHYTQYSPTAATPCGDGYYDFATGGPSGLVSACGVPSPSWSYFPAIQFCTAAQATGGAADPYWAGITSGAQLTGDCDTLNTCITHYYVCD